jgi:hypothetical protein
MGGRIPNDCFTAATLSGTSNTITPAITVTLI